MQLTGLEIQRIMNIPNPKNPDCKPNIIIEPFNEKCLGSNSYDLHLGPKLKIYAGTLMPGMKPAIPATKGTNWKDYSMRDWFTNWKSYIKYRMGSELYDVRNPRYTIDPFDKNKEELEIDIPEVGLILSPAMGYLGRTAEYTETRNIFPYIDGKSSIGRLFILTHHTAGRGDDGFCGTWTLEIAVRHPILLKQDMRIGQIYYEHFVGKRKQYGTETSAHYNNQINATSAAIIAVEASAVSTR